MSLNWLLSVDYQAVASHLQAQLKQAPDEPEQMLGFSYFHGVLKEHVDNLMTGEPFNEDTVLTDILFAEYDLGVIDAVSVTDRPGTVVRVGGRNYILPLVKIEVKFT